MILTNNIYKSSNIYRQWQTSGHSGGPLPGDDDLAAGMPVDQVTISEQATKEENKNRNAGPAQAGERELDPRAKQQIKDLKKRDSEVKAHEQAHMASGGGIVQGGATFEYQAGPDGKMYAVGGEVRIDTSPGRTAQATIRKMQQVRRAALAPAQPSGTDRAVAAKASRVEAQARMEQAQKGLEGRDDADQTVDPVSSVSRRAAEPNVYLSNREAKGRSIDMLA